MASKIDALKVAQENEKYMLCLRQELARCKLELEEALEKVNQNLEEIEDSDLGDLYSLYSINFYVTKVLEAFLDTQVLYFPFGKYKGRIVQDVLEKDLSYCTWFSKNVRGTDIGTLQLLDFLCKKLHGETEIEKRYYTVSVRDTLDMIILNHIPLNGRNSINTESILEKFSYKAPKGSYSKNYGYFSDDMSVDEGSFFYYGDCVVDYGDLC